MEPEAGRHLLDLDLEGIREAPLGLVVVCDRRTAAVGVLGRATFVDADLWSCACAIENLWLAARAEGLGVGWVTLFEPGELAACWLAPRRGSRPSAGSVWAGRTSGRLRPGSNGGAGRRGCPLPA